MIDETIRFKLQSDSPEEMKEIMKQVYAALKEKGYNPINQLVGYIISEDPTHITNYKNARTLIGKLDRDELLDKMVESYISTLEKEYNEK